MKTKPPNIAPKLKVGNSAEVKEGKLYTEFTPKSLAQLLETLSIPSKIIECTTNTSHKRNHPGLNKWGNYIIQKSPDML